jgi:hypothetical protein
MQNNITIKDYTMFQKTAFIMGLLASIASYADVYVNAQLEIIRYAQKTHITFNTMVPTAHYDELTTFIDETGYRLSIRVLEIADNGPIIEFIVKDTNDTLMLNPTLCCTWNTPASASIVTKDLDEAAQLSLSVCVNQTPPFKEHTIDRNDYNAIKNAVFAKKGSDYAASFDELYPIPNDASVIALSKEFDANSLNLWLETYPPQSTAYINGKRFHINGAIAIILYYLPYND